MEVNGCRQNESPISESLNQERNLHRSSSVYKTKQDQNESLNKYVAGFWCERQQEMHFSLEEALLWIMDSYILVKNILMLDLFQLLSSPDVN